MLRDPLLPKRVIPEANLQFDAHQIIANEILDVRKALVRHKRDRKIISEYFDCCNISSDGNWIFYVTGVGLLKATSVANLEIISNNNPLLASKVDRIQSLNIAPRTYRVVCRGPQQLFVYEFSEGR